MAKASKNVEEFTFPPHLHLMNIEDAPVKPQQRWKTLLAECAILALDIPSSAAVTFVIPQASMVQLLQTEEVRSLTLEGHHYRRLCDAEIYWLQEVIDDFRLPGCFAVALLIQQFPEHEGLWIMDNVIH